tara:strand:+ start:3881 stop:7069 length:3189 start_codon:yes stop_codon:yes gene_type:complete
MDRLSDLNNYSNENITYDDARTTNVIFDRAVPQNQTITISENQPHYLPLGIDIREIIDYANASVYLELDFSLVNDPVSFAEENLPFGVSITETAPNVFKFSPINNDSIWRQIVDTVDINMPFQNTGLFVYVPTIHYTIGTTNFTKSWNVEITIELSEYMSQPTNYVYVPNRTVALDNIEIIIDEGLFNPTWTMTLVPSNLAVADNITSSGTGGTTQFDNGIFTIFGNKTEVNSHLNSIVVDYSFYSGNFYWSYILSNNFTSAVETIVQYATNKEIAATLTDIFGFVVIGSSSYMLPSDLGSTATIVCNTTNSLIKRFPQTNLGSVTSLTTFPISIDSILLSNAGNTETYYTNKTFNITSASNIIADYDELAEDITWTVTITNGSTNIETISTSGTGGTVNIYTPSSGNDFKIVEIIGTKTEVNSHLNSISIKSKTTSQNNISLNYTASFGGTYVYTTSQIIYYRSDFLYADSWPYWGATVPTWQGRVFLSNKPNLIFGDEILTTNRNFAFVPNDSDYTNLTVTLTANAGKFYNPANEDYDSTITITGTYATFESIMRLVEYWPTYGYTGNTTVTFTSTKDSESGQFGSFSVNYNGVGIMDTKSYTSTTAGSFSYIPTAEELEYGKLNYLIVGAGGGGSFRSPEYSSYIDVESNGGIGLSTAQKKFGNASVYFDGVDDYLYFTGTNNRGSSTISFNTNGSFDAWIRLDNITGTKYIVDLLGDFDGDTLKIWIVDDTLYVEQVGNQTLSLEYTGLTANTWTHIAFQADQGGVDTHRLFVNGVTVDSATGVDCQISGNYTIYMGCDRTESNFFQGYMDEIRFNQIPYVGLTSFSVPTAEYATTDYPSLLIHGNILTDCPKPIHHDTYAGISTYAGHGGGAGEVLSYLNQTLENKTYTGNIGTSGVNGFDRFNLDGIDGGDTIFEGITANGGGGATSHKDQDEQFFNTTGDTVFGAGGTSGSGYTGATFYTTPNLNASGAAGGGGGGSSSNGFVATFSGSTLIAGRGGNGGSVIVRSGQGGNGGYNTGAAAYTPYISSLGEGGQGYGPSANRQPSNGAIVIIINAK